MRSWVLPGNTADVTTVARIKDDLRAWRLGRCLFVGDAGMYSADNLAQLSRGLGRYILAVPMRRVRDIEDEVLTRPGRYKQVADNLQVKEVWLGDGGDLLGLWANTNDGEFLAPVTLVPAERPHDMSYGKRDGPEVRLPS